MAYRHDTYKYKNKKIIEHEFKYAGRYGAKGEKRAQRKKATPEQMKKQNQYNREKLVLRKMRNNFKRGDLWITLKLKKGERVSAQEILKIREKFLRQLRGVYKKRGRALKYMCRIEIGERGGIHIQILVNRIKGTPGTAEDISQIWGRLTGGHVNYAPVYEEGHFKDLADYLVKKPKEEITGQLTLFGTEEERKIFSEYTCSKNLELPEKETHDYKHWTLRKLVENGPEPKPGYYIDRDSIRHGKNRYTGMSYYYYTENRLARDAGEIRREREDLYGQSVYTPLRP